MGLDGNLSYVTPDLEEEVFNFGRSTAAVHHFLVKLAAREDEEEEKRILEKGECILRLDDMFFLEDEILSTIADDKESYLKRVEHGESWEKEVSGIDRCSKALKRSLLDISRQVIFEGLDGNFVYFKYEWS